MDQNKLHYYTLYFLKGKLLEQNEKELLLWIKQSEKNMKLFMQEQQRLSNEIISDNDNSINIRWQALKKIIEQEQGITKRHFIYRISKFAAAFIAGIVLTIVLSDVYKPFINQSTQVQNITVPYGARTSTILPDGSKVWLNSGTTLTFPAAFGKLRNVTLNGEAFFEVVKDNSPFMVETVYGEVEVKGTSFNVRAYEFENLQATLVEGSVSMRNYSTNKEVTLLPGQHAVLQNKTVTVTNVATEIYTSWTEGKVIFRKAYMPEVAKRLERWYNVKIVLDEDPRLNQIWYSGTVEMESFSEILALLKVTAPIDYSYDEKKRIITIKYLKTKS
jgi:transmembrane sensor